ncbi:MAG TPA: SRPBCC family protein [Flavobacteriaceae bacterium]|nr:SRPBCC family protein [Flavobacteriaceae bacterium]
MQLESQTNVSKSPEKVYDFLMKVENYEKLMPESNQRFEILNVKSFLFQLSGMPEIQLEIKDSKLHEKVVLGSLGEKLPFTLTANISEISENESKVQLLFEGTFNSMMGMMIKGPIQKFINTLSENLGKI